MIGGCCCAGEYPPSWISNYVAPSRCSSMHLEAHEYSSLQTDNMIVLIDDCCAEEMCSTMHHRQCGCSSMRVLLQAINRIDLMDLVIKRDNSPPCASNAIISIRLSFPTNSYPNISVLLFSFSQSTLSSRLHQPRVGG